LHVFRLTSALAALALAAVAAGCATPQASTEPAAASKAADKDAKISHKNDSDDYITGSRLPRKATQNTEGTRGASPAEYRRYEPPQRGPVSQ
jgi:hypothetical protein